MRALPLSAVAELENWIRTYQEERAWLLPPSRLATRFLARVLYAHQCALLKQDDSIRAIHAQSLDRDRLDRKLGLLALARRASWDVLVEQEEEETQGVPLLETEVDFYRGVAQGLGLEKCFARGACLYLNGQSHAERYVLFRYLSGQKLDSSQEEVLAATLRAMPGAFQEKRPETKPAMG